MQYRNPHLPQPQLHHLSDDTQNLTSAREFIKGLDRTDSVDKLYFVSLSRAPPNQEGVHFFTTDQQFVYTNFYADFGPSNMSHVVRFCYFMQDMFQKPELANKTLCLYTSFDIDRRANAAFLLCAYMVLVYKNTPEDAYQCLMGISPPFVPYRDAGYGPATYHITILDCIRGLSKAIQTGLFNLDKFDLEEYVYYERVENGDYNWITNKFLALAAPKDDTPGMFDQQSKQTVTRQGKSLYSAYKINNLIKWMVENNIRTIIRLNNKTYDKSKFVAAGIEHIDLYFPDGSTPPDGILKRFLEVCESRAGPIAVHCKAGLGRTGSLIAAYLMKHYRLTACEVISFMRVIRPGSVVGPQQNYLQAMQPKLWKMTPSIRLAPEISCYLAPSQVVVTRFGPARFAWKLASHPPLPNDRIRTASEPLSREYKNSESDSLQASRREVMLVQSVYGDVQEYERELARERSSATSRQEIEGLAIPIQPRKHLGAQRQIDPTNAGWKQAGAGFQSSAFSHHSNHQDNGNARYHLRSQSGTGVSLKPRVEGSNAGYTIESIGDMDIDPVEKALNAKKSSLN